MNGDMQEADLLFDQYINKQLDSAAVEAFEKRLEEDSEFKADFRTFLQSKASIYQAGVKEEKALFESKREDMIRRHQQVQVSKERFLRRRRLMMMAAGFVILLSLVFLLMPNEEKQSPEALYAQYFEAPEIPAQLSIDQDSLLTVAYKNFNIKAYKLALTQFKVLEMESFPPPIQSEIMLFAGVSALESSQGQEARSFLNLALQHPQEASWYIALSWLKEGQKENAEKAFKQIVDTEGHFYQESAKKILDML